MFTDFRERAKEGGKEGAGGEGERDTHTHTHIDMREKHQLVASHMYPTRDEPTTFLVYRMALQLTEPHGQGFPAFFFNFISF